LTLKSSYAGVMLLCEVTFVKQNLFILYFAGIWYFGWLL